MSMLSIGQIGVTQVSKEIIFDPTIGFVTTEVYEGTESAMRSIVLTLENANDGTVRGRCYPHNGPVWRASLTYGWDSSSGTYPAIDSWEFETEYAQEDMFNHPNIEQSAGSADIVIEWRDDIADMMTKGDHGGPIKPGLTGFTGTKKTLYTLYAKGQRSYEVERPVLKRYRTYSFDYSQRTKIDTVPTVYKTSRLISVFNIPQGIANLLPDDPPYQPENTSWAWKRRRNVSRIIPVAYKVEETMDWVFAAWSDITHTVLS